MPETYILTSPSGRQYVGVTTKTALERFEVHATDSLSGKYPRNPLARAIRKYGPEEFRVRTLFVGSWEYVLELEERLIQVYGTMRPGGYNAKHGGTGGRMPEGTRRQMSESRKKLLKDPAARERFSKSQLEIWQRPGYRERMQAAHRGHKTSPETIEKMRLATKRRYEVPGARVEHSIRMKKWWADKRAREAGVPSV